MLKSMKWNLIFLLAASLVLGAGLAVAEDDPEMAAKQAELAKKSQNPVADIISIPFEFWHHDGEYGDGFVGILKPVYPTPVGSLNLINRFLLPYANIDGIMQTPGMEAAPPAIDEKGLLDITYQGFLSPQTPGDIIWGAGWALQMPTASNDALGTDRWSLGPSAVVLTMPKSWVLGLLIQNVWDIAGSGDADINKLTLQPIVNYQLGQGWYLTSTPVITADWTAESGNKWNVPLGAGLGKLQRVGKLPVDFKLVYYSYVEQTAVGPDWSVLFGIKFLLPR